MVTAGMDATEASVALKLGVSGLILKHSPPNTLMKVIRLVASGETWFEHEIIQQIADRALQDNQQRRPHTLTKREDQILQGVFEGLTNKEIAAKMDVSETSVKATLQQLFHKTGVRTRSQLVRIALEGSFHRNKL